MRDFLAQIAQLSIEKQKYLWEHLEELTDVFPLSFFQQRLWLQEQLEPDTSLNTLFFSLNIEGPLSFSALERSLQEIVRRHEILRTVFATLDGKPVQIVLSFQANPLPVIALTEFRDEARWQEAERIMREKASEPFDLARGPLFSCWLLRLHEQKHVLLLHVHHIVFDGWSQDLFFQELSALYNAFSQGKSSPLPELQLQYIDYAVWQQKQLAGERLQTLQRFWREVLNEAPGELSWFTDFPRPATQTHRGKTVRHTITDATVKRVKVLCAEEQATLFMVLLAAFVCLLNKQTAQDDLVIGTPVAHRPSIETASLIGPFLNILPLRVQVRQEETCRQLLQAIRQVTLAAYEHQDMPFEKVIELLNIQRNLSFNPLFQVFFNLLNFHKTPVTLQGLIVEPSLSFDIGAKFDLTLYVQEEDTSLSLTLVYNPDLFMEERIAFLLSQYEYVVQQIVEQPDQQIQNISLVSSEEQSLLPDPRQQTEAFWYGPIQQSVMRWALKQPERIALSEQGGIQLTYRELEDMSSNLAWKWSALGLGKGDIIAIYGCRCATLPVAILGALKAGCAYTILDPAYPDARLCTYLDITRPRGFCHIEAAGPLPTALTSCLRKLHVHLLGIESLEQLRESDGGKKSFSVEISANDLACITFTSGSTGGPKGVLGRHDPLTHFLPWQERTFELGSSDRFSLLSGLSHDPLQRDIFTALWPGATIFIPRESDARDPLRLFTWARDKKITVMHLTPALLRLLIGGATVQKDVLPCLRYVFVVGDILKYADVMALEAIAPQATCVNLYGSTETQRSVGYYIVPRAHELSHAHFLQRKASIPLGRGVENVQLLVLNHGQVAGVGEIGEIYVRSRHLAAGYLADPLLTEQRFLPNPYTQDRDDRLYRTGDIGRFLPDGNVEFLGRRDQQVKIRGFRVDPGEIEFVLSQHPLVWECAVLPSPASTDSHPTLLAYVSAKPGQTLDEERIHQFLKGRLPEYMVPAAVVVLPTLPKTPNGKIDHARLRAITPVLQKKQAEIQWPQTALERRIAAIWCEVLKKEAIGLDENFFDLGGNSLLIAEAHVKICQEFSLHLSLLDLFRNPTVAYLARSISQKEPNALPREDIIERATRQRAILAQRKPARAKEKGTDE
jgi:amino acid adenylation domain-containing protein